MVRLVLTRVLSTFKRWRNLIILSWIYVVVYRIKIIWWSWNEFGWYEYQRLQHFCLPFTLMQQDCVTTYEILFSVSQMTHYIVQIKEKYLVVATWCTWMSLNIPSRAGINEMLPVVLLNLMTETSYQMFYF